MNKLHRWLIWAGVVVLTACGAGGTGEDQTGTTTEALIPAGSDAHFVGTSGLPASLFPGERRMIQVTMQNTGAASPANDWTPAAYALSGWSPAWGWSDVRAPSTVVVGASNTFNIIVTAPDASGPFQAQMSVSREKFGDRVSVPVTIDPSVTPQWGCTFVPEASTVPTTLAPGEARGTFITVRNTGSATWPAAGLRLVSEDNPVNFWHQTVVDLTTAVPPGSTTSFWVPITAPTTPGTYPFQREMKDYNAGGVGDFRRAQHCVSTSIVVGGEPPLSATLASQSFPTPMAPTETKAVTVRMNNTGTKDWTADGSYMLFSLNSPVNLWGVTQAPLAVAVPSGSSGDLVLHVTAPSTPGSYVQRWQMRKTGGTDAAFFGEIINVAVTVSTSVTPEYGAKVVSNTTPGSMITGQSYPVAITMQNTGTATWTSNVLLDSTNTPSNLWGVTISPLSSGETVAPGASRTFSFTVKAPSTAGTYQSSWRMRSNAVGRFGAAALTTVAVAPGCPSAPALPAGTYHLDVTATSCTEDLSSGQRTCSSNQHAATLKIAPYGEPTFSVTVLDVGIPFGGVSSSFYPYIPPGGNGINPFPVNEVRQFPFDPYEAINFTIDLNTGGIADFNYAESHISPFTRHSYSIAGSGWRVCEATAAPPPT